MNKANVSFGCLEEESLSIDELCVAGACMGYLSAPNVKAKILNCPGHMLRAETLGLLGAMESKGFVQCSFDKRPIVIKRIGQLVATVCNPEQITLINWSIADDKHRTASIYMRSKHCVIIDEEGRIFSSDNMESVAKGVTERIGASAFEAFSGESFSLLFDEFRYAKKLVDSFQNQLAEEFLSKCIDCDEALQLLMKVISGSPDYIIMSRWQKRKNFFAMVSSDYVAVVENQLVHIKSSPEGSIKFKGTAPERLDVRIKEYCGMVGEEK